MHEWRNKSESPSPPHRRRRRRPRPAERARSVTSAHLAPLAWSSASNPATLGTAHTHHAPPAPSPRPDRPRPAPRRPLVVPHPPPHPGRSSPRTRPHRTQGHPQRPASRRLGWDSEGASSPPPPPPLGALAADPLLVSHHQAIADYLPHLYAILACVEADDLLLRTDPGASRSRPLLLVLVPDPHASLAQSSSHGERLSHRTRSRRATSAPFCRPCASSVLRPRFLCRRNLADSPLPAATLSSPPPSSRTPCASPTRPRASSPRSARTRLRRPLRRPPSRCTTRRSTRLPTRCAARAASSCTSPRSSSRGGRRPSGSTPCERGLSR